MNTVTQCKHQEHDDFNQHRYWDLARDLTSIPKLNVEACLQRPALLPSHKLSAISVRAVLAESVRVRIVRNDVLPVNAIAHPTQAVMAPHVRLLEHRLLGAHGGWEGRGGEGPWGAAACPILESNGAP